MSKEQRAPAGVSQPTGESPRAEPPEPDVVAAIRAQLEAGTLSLPAAVWQLLEVRRGETFCASCLQGLLLTRRRIDRFLIMAEGRGAIRRHLPCSVCGTDRLVIGLR